MDEAKILELKQLVLKQEARRWKAKADYPTVFAELSNWIGGVLSACDVLGIDLGLRRAGAFIKEIENGGIK